MNARSGIDGTPDQWRQFIEAAASAVRQSSPGTRIGAGAYTQPVELPYYEEFARIPALDFLTIDNYADGPAAIGNLERMTQLAHGVHKAVYLEETWRPHMLSAGWRSRYKTGESLDAVATKGAGNIAFEPLDAKWLHLMALYAATHGLEAMTPFTTPTFFLYVDSGPDSEVSSEYIRQVQQAISIHQRTDTFRAFQQCVQEFGQGDRR
jgi:hypothetical protein